MTFNELLVWIGNADLFTLFLCLIAFGFVVGIGRIIIDEIRGY